MMTTSGRSRAAASNRRRTAHAVSSGWVASPERPSAARNLTLDLLVAEVAELVDDLGQRAVGDALAVARAPRRHHGRAAGGRLRLARQPRLADARGSGDGDEPRRALPLGAGERA